MISKVRKSFTRADFQSNNLLKISPNILNIGQPKKETIFSSKFEIKNLRLPNEILEVKTRYKKEHIEIIHKFTKELGFKIFLNNIQQMFFPREFNILVSNCGKDKNEIQKLKQVNEALKILDNLLDERPKDLLRIKSFVFLYCSLIVLICSNHETKRALIFLKRFLDFYSDIDKFLNEAFVAFHSIMFTKSSDESVKGFSQQILAIIGAKHEQLRNRLIMGRDSKNKFISENCSRACDLIVHSSSQFGTGYIQVPVGEDKNSALAILDQNIENIHNTDTFDNKQAVLRNIVNVLQNFESEYDVVLKAYELFLLAFDKIFDESTKMDQTITNLLGEIIVFCFQNVEKSFAVDESDRVINEIFEKSDKTQLLNSIESVIDGTDDSILNRIEKMVTTLGDDDLEMMKDARIVNQDIQKGSELRISDIDDIVFSISRMMDPEGIFPEMERIVGLKDPLIIEKYPSYLRGFLFRAYVLYNDTIPENIPDDQLRIVNDMLAKYKNIGPEEDSLSVESLQNVFNGIKQMELV